MIWEVEIADSLDCLPGEPFQELWREQWSCLILLQLGQRSSSAREQEALRALILGLVKFAYLLG